MARWYWYCCYGTCCFADVISRRDAPFKTESYETADKVIPRATQLAGGIFIAYTSMTGLWAIMLGMAGMPGFDALAHAMTTIATGGYSTVIYLWERMILAD